MFSCRKIEMSTKKHCTLILLSGGQGKRMGTDKAKQYLELGGKPVIEYSLEAVERSEVIDDCILVVRPEDRTYVRETILAGNRFEKVRAIADGGRERSESVWNGLKLIHELFGGCEQGNGFPDVIYIHDGARPFLDEKMIRDCYDDAIKYRACVIGYPSRDTVKVVDAEGIVVDTPDRRALSAVQTPQGFLTDLVKTALTKAVSEGKEYTDDCAAVEALGAPTYLCEGSSENIKITKPMDISLAELIIRQREAKA